MNKYIKKCLVVYVSMAIILCGMVGITYAITATDADQYVTRSQYAVDMAHLQNKLDEAEAGLLGNINRYRSTDIKFVTFDTPDRSYVSQGALGGYYNGGNLFLRPRVAGTSGYQRYYWGLAGGSVDFEYARYRMINIYRLYNGNYYIAPPMYGRQAMSSGYEYYTGVNFAVPIENFPGWYIVFYTDWASNTTVTYYISITKLDPKVPYSTYPRRNQDVLQFRFKKDLFTYYSPDIAKLTTTKQSANVNVRTINNSQSWNAFTRLSRSEDATFPTQSTWSFSGQVDPETGDYLFTISGDYRCHDGNNWMKAGPIQSANCFFTRFIPSDNVEYVSGANSTCEYSNWDSTGNSAYLYALPPDLVRENIPNIGYEFVDCENGIKYWHAYLKSPEQGATKPFPYRWHYSLPIVY